MRPQPAEGPVQLEQLQGVAVQPPTDQETWEVWRQEEQWADVSLIGHKDRQRRDGLVVFGLIKPFVFVHNVSEEQRSFTDHVIHTYPPYA